jgi:hypothetical protein
MSAVLQPVFLEAVGFAAPGLPSWQAASVVLRGEAPYQFAPLAAHVPAMLPVNERRRATPAVKLAFQAAENAMSTAALPAAGLATVFASSDADLNIIHRICSALANTPRLISPTDFHNSVHNAAAGYWHIAAGARTASSTISAYDGSFAAGLLEASLQVRVQAANVLLVAFDLPAPEPLHATRPMAHPAAVALVLTGEPSRASLAALSCELTADGEDALTGPLESLRLGNPATRTLPLLRRIARGEYGRSILPYGNGVNLAVQVSAP